VGEVPLLKELYQRLGKQDVIFLGVSIDEDVSALDKMVREKGIPWTQICDGRGTEGEVSKAFHFSGNTPYFYVVDREGRIASRFRNAKVAEQRLNEALSRP
jgi:peroxiredoxin